MRNEHLETPLHVALRTDNPEKASRWLIKMGADVTALDGAKVPIGVLAWVKCRPAFDMMKHQLLQFKDNAAALEQFSYTKDQAWLFQQLDDPLLKCYDSIIGGLHLACMLGLPEAVDLVNEAPVAYDPIFGWPMDIAIAYRHTAIVQLLHSHGATGSLHLAAEHGNAAIVEIVLENVGTRRRIKLYDANNKLPLHYAVESGDLEVVKLLLLHGSDVNASDGSNTPLHIAVYMGNIELVKWLLIYGASVHAFNAMGYQPLHISAEAGSTSIAQWLLTSGGELANQYDKNKMLPIHHATKSGHFECVLMLWRYGLDAKDGTGNTPLHIAVRNGDMHLTQLLLEFRATVNTSGRGGNHPLHYAVQNRNFRLVRLLLAYGAQVNASNDRGVQPLHMAEHIVDSEIWWSLRYGAYSKELVPGLMERFEYAMSFF